MNEAHVVGYWKSLMISARRPDKQSASGTVFCTLPLRWVPRSTGRPALLVGGVIVRCGENWKQKGSK